MAASGMQFIVANEILKNSKILLYSFIASLVLFIFMFFNNRPDYYTQDEINKRKEFDYKNSMKKSDFQLRYNKFEEESGLSNTQIRDYATSYSSRKSKYFDCTIGNAQIDEQGRNEQAEACFINDIKDISFRFFLAMAGSLIAIRYILLLYKWAINVVK